MTAFLTYLAILIALMTIAAGLCVKLEGVRHV